MSDDFADITESSGNVFEDLGLPEPEEALAKADLAIQIRRIAKQRHLSQAETARILGTTQPKVSELFAGKLAGYSIERLIRYLNALGQDVEIVVLPKPQGRERAVTRVTGASAPVTRLSASHG